MEMDPDTDTVPGIALIPVMEAENERVVVPVNDGVNVMDRVAMCVTLDEDHADDEP